MNAAPSSEPNESIARQRSVSSGLAALVALIGIAVLIGVIDLLASGQSLSVSAALASWAWVLNVVLVLLAIVIVIWVVRLVAWGVGGVPPSERYERRRERRRSLDRSAGSDPAVEMARERFARGEISQDQFDQTVRKLGKGT